MRWTVARRRNATVSPLLSSSVHSTASLMRKFFASSNVTAPLIPPTREPLRMQNRPARRFAPFLIQRSSVHCFGLRSLSSPEKSEAFLHSDSSQSQTELDSYCEQEFNFSW